MNNYREISIAITLALLFWIGLMLLFGCESERKYTVRFINKYDTTYLLNSRPLTIKEAKRVAEGYPGKAEPVLFGEGWR